MTNGIFLFVFFMTLKSVNIYVSLLVEVWGGVVSIMVVLEFVIDGTSDMGTAGLDYPLSNIEYYIKGSSNGEIPAPVVQCHHCSSLPQ